MTTVFTQKKIKAVYLGSTRVRPPSEAYVNFLLVGGGGGGGGCGGGGGGGGYVLCCDYLLSQGEHCIVRGSPGQSAYTRYGRATDGGPTCLDNIVAYGGGAGGGVLNNECCGNSGGSGGGGGPSYGQGAAGCPGQGNKGGNGAYSSCGGAGGGGGGAGGAGCNGNSNERGGNGGPGIDVCVYGTIKQISGGGGGIGYNICGTATHGGGAGSYYGCSGTAYTGGGGGGSRNGWGSMGGTGVAIIWYPADSYIDISGGDCTFVCNGYCVHCFTSDGTLTVN